ncbi:MAG: DUF3085 domain-containing protein [Thermoplasmataceae archaeon]
MKTLIFEVGAVRRLIAHARAAQNHNPGWTDMEHPEYYPGGKIITGAHGLPEGKHIDKSKVPPALWLVKDRGVYLMSNGDPGLMRDTKTGSHEVVYAEGCDPDRCPNDWYDNSLDIMGGDDCSETIAVGDFEEMMRGAKDTDLFRIRVTGNSMALLRVTAKIPAPKKMAPHG